MTKQWLTGYSLYSDDFSGGEMYLSTGIENSNLYMRAGYQNGSGMPASGPILAPSTKIKSALFNDRILIIEVLENKNILATYTINDLNEFLALQDTRLTFNTPLNKSATFNFYSDIKNNAPTVSTIPAQSTQLNANKTLNVAPYFSDLDGDALTFTASSSNTAVGTVSVSGSTLTLRPVALGSTTITVTANDGKGGTVATIFTFSVVNSVPTVSVSSPAANVTLYENDTLNIAGNARDEDSNQSVTVYYQINSESRRVLATDLSQKNITLSKQLTFKGGKLYDGATAVTGALTEGVIHKLKVWAQDGDGGQSTIAERTFYVVPNRAPSLTVNTPSISGNIDTDKVQFNGTYSDPDGNACTVSYKVNSGNSVQVASGTSGNWSFELPFGSLKLGENNIVIENIDSYGAKTSKTIKLNKTAIETPLLKSVARYKLTPPLNEATGVLLYVQRSADLAIDVKISMTLAGEPENFVPMSLENTAPVPNEVGIVEDELYYIASESKQNIIVQIDMERSSVNVSDKIIVIEGAFY